MPAWSAQGAALAGTVNPLSGSVLSNGLSAALSLHQHFYENHLPDVTVIDYVENVGIAVDLMQDLFAPEASH